MMFSFFTKSREPPKKSPPRSPAQSPSRSRHHASSRSKSKTISDDRSRKLDSRLRETAPSRSKPKTVSDSRGRRPDSRPRQTTTPRDKVKSSTVVKSQSLDFWVIQDKKEAVKRIVPYLTGRLAENHQLETLRKKKPWIEELVIDEEDEDEENEFQDTEAAFWKDPEAMVKELREITRLWFRLLLRYTFRAKHESNWKKPSPKLDLDDLDDDDFTSEMSEKQVQGITQRKTLYNEYRDSYKETKQRPGWSRFCARIKAFSELVGLQASSSKMEQMLKDFEKAVPNLKKSKKARPQQGLFQRLQGNAKPERAIREEPKPRLQANTKPERTVREEPKPQPGLFQRLQGNAKPERTTREEPKPRLQTNGKTDRTTREEPKSQQGIAQRLKDNAKSERAMREEITANAASVSALRQRFEANKAESAASERALRERLADKEKSDKALRERLAAKEKSDKTLRERLAAKEKDDQALRTRLAANAETERKHRIHDSLVSCRELIEKLVGELSFGANFRGQQYKQRWKDMFHEQWTNCKAKRPAGHPLSRLVTQQKYYSIGKELYGTISERLHNHQEYRDKEVDEDVLRMVHAILPAVYSNPNSTEAQRDWDLVKEKKRWGLT